MKEYIFASALTSLFVSTVLTCILRITEVIKKDKEERKEKI